MIKYGNMEIGADCMAFGLTVTWRRYAADAGLTNTHHSAISIQQTSTADDGIFAPAVDIQVTGAQSLRILRNAIDEALKYVPDVK